MTTVTRRAAPALAAALTIAGVGCVLGLLAHTLSSTALPLKASAPKAIRHIALADARRIFEGDAAQFVDARSSREFGAGHIAGSINVPFNERAGEFERLRAGFPRTRTLIVYCEGGACESAEHLGAWFVDNGWRDVRVLDVGYPAWRAADFPVSPGAE